MSEPEVIDQLLDRVIASLGGQRREGQHQMARAVARAGDQRRHLLVQAGTGTGKSLAYLIPALRYAIAREPVVISTATLALQRQIIGADLPAALAALDGDKPSVALLKGRANYLCRYKLDGGYPAEDAVLFDLGSDSSDHPSAVGPSSALGAQITRLREWAEQTETGDRDDLQPGVTHRAWTQVSVSALECLGQRCPMVTECFAERARQQALDADVIVTNHAMLAIQASDQTVLPDHGLLIVDEAHELTDRITSAHTQELSARLVQTAVHRLARTGRAAPELEQAGNQLGSALAELGEGQITSPVPQALTAVVAALNTVLRAIARELKPSPEPDGAHKRAEAAVSALIRVCERIADAGDYDVVWCASEVGESEPALHIAPLQVSGVIRNSLLVNATGVFTSATLALGGSLEPTAWNLGLTGASSEPPPRPTPTANDDEDTAADAGPDDAPDGAGSATAGLADDDEVRSSLWWGVDVGSPFDYAHQGIIYIARHLPPPSRGGVPPEQHAELAELIQAAGGRTLGLFSSRRAAEEAALAVRALVAVPILCQGDELLAGLLTRFVAEPNTCLFGTLSLWQGVDASGPTCQLVTIDRIPFPRPDDPVRSARARAAEKAGRNGFMTVAAAHAALLLAQGAGRLIRRTSDRGVVAVLDSRLATARYGEFLLRSMPPMWRTVDKAVVLGALARLDESSTQEV